MANGARLAFLGVAAAMLGQGAEAAPLATMQYSIGSLSQALQFMGDGSVLVACDGSVSVACDGSVVPVPVRGAQAAVAGDGSVRLLTPLVMLGDGSVRLVDTSVVPATENGLLLPAVSFIPFPMIAATVGVIDNGDPTSFLITFGTVMNLAGPGYSYSLSGGGTLTDMNGDRVGLGAGSAFGETAVLFGQVDGALVASTGTSASFPPPATGGIPPFVYPYTAADVSGAGTCASCDLLAMTFAFTASGGGDRLDLFATFDVNPVGVPAPAPLGLLAAGLAMLGLVRLRPARG
ncbi:hypothetical protein [Elioraea rosea]|uniref:hypothetical protein n=1 Tax=Elioraea rosea TaxID=2492390 RepID=UPI0013158EF3|nr:hypothetical protein [Elioraea rosea]